MNLLINLLMEVAATGGKSFPTAFVAVYVVGFIAAVSIGSIAWYNSKRPAGWEGQKRPDFVPDLEAKESKGTETTKE